MSKNKKNQKKVVGVKLQEELEKIARDMKFTFLEAAIYYCEKNKIEVESIANVIKQNRKMKSKIKADAEKINCLKDD